ncbi:MAG: DUF1016 N-terminal domain-containing protein [Planctomycetaceae bacterium]
MARQQSSPAQSVVRVDVAGLIADVKQRIQSAQTRAVLAVNSELVRLYWDIGRLIANRQQREGWGAGVIPRLASQLKHELPGLKGFSERNIDRMIAFYLAYPGQGEISPPPVAKLTQAKLTRAKLTRAKKVPLAVAKLSDSVFWTVGWAHHVILMQKVKDLATRLWDEERDRQTDREEPAPGVKDQAVRPQKEGRFGISETAATWSTALPPSSHAGSSPVRGTPSCGPANGQRQLAGVTVPRANDSQTPPAGPGFPRFFPAQPQARVGCDAGICWRRFHRGTDVPRAPGCRPTQPQAPRGVRCGDLLAALPPSD